jgi:hypothetical protein
MSKVKKTKNRQLEEELRINFPVFEETEEPEVAESEPMELANDDAE